MSATSVIRRRLYSSSRRTRGRGKVEDEKKKDGRKNFDDSGDDHVNETKPGQLFTTQANLTQPIRCWTRPNPLEIKQATQK